jgi:arylsulfatase A-like enzyme
MPSKRSNAARLSRRSFLGALAALRPAAAASRPNVVLILADDLGYECLNSYGGTSYRTPNLDAMARSGVRFTHAFAQPLCTPTRLQLMTGQHNFRNWRAFGIMDPKERTFGHMMRNAGYRTCIAGKWQMWSYDGPGSPRRGIGQRPEDCGFHEYSLWHAEHTEQKGSRYADPVIKENGKLRTDTKGKYGEDLFCEYVCGFMERNKDRPFFVYYPMALTHGPFNLTPRSADWAAGDRLRGNPKYFADMVVYMDEVVGRVLKKIDGLGLGSNTLVLFYSDNGTAQGLRSRMGARIVEGGKGLTTDAGMHVPLIARWTGKAAPGRVLDDLVDSTDFLPTIAETTGAKWFSDLPVDGRSFLPQILGRKVTPRDALFAHYDPHPGCKVKYPPTRFAWDHHWKLYMDGRLYNLDKDILEKSPLEEGEGGPGAAAARKKLQAVLDRLAKVKSPRFNEFSAYGEA